MKTIVVIYGTRPEFIKVVPVVKALQSSNNKVLIVNTGQHREMVLELEKIFRIEPDFRFDIMRNDQSLNYTLSEMIKRFDSLLQDLKPDLVLVQGDTNSVLAAGIASFYLGIKVGHIEAGLRSFDLQHPFPEEFNRRVVSIFSSINFVPTAIASENLIKEGISPEKICITGNTIVDSVLLVKELLQLNPNKTKKQVLVTAHRRENHDVGLVNICEAIRKAALIHSEYTFLWPVHPNPKVKGVVFEKLRNINNIKLCDPLNYSDLLREMMDSELVMTDSGGIQEESTILKKPVLVLRSVTERPEVINSGYGVIVDTDVERILYFTALYLNPNYDWKKDITCENPFGDGTASKKIIDEIENLLK